MRLFSDKRASAIRETVQLLANREINRCTHNITSKDLFNVFVQPEHKEMVRDIMKVAKVADAEQQFMNEMAVQHSLGNMAVWVTYTMPVGQPFKFLVPTYATTGPVNADPDNRSYIKISDYTNRRVDIGIRWGRVMDVLHQCDLACSSVAEMKLVFPGIVGILKQHDVTRKLGEHAANSKALSIPAISREFREAARMATAQVIGVLLLEDAPPPENAKTVGITIRGADKSQLYSWSKATSSFF